MIVDPDFLTHWKTQMLIVEMNDPAAPLYVIALWGHCQQRRKSHFDSLPLNGLKAICRYPGDPALLLAALTNSGFLDETEAGFTVHDWDDVNAKLVAQWENGRKGGAHGKPKPTPPAPQADPTGNPRLPDREERRGEDGLEEREQIKAALDAVIPSAADVVKFGLGCTPVIPAEYSTEQHAKHSETHRWITANGLLIDWRQRFRRYWSSDRESWGQRRNGHAKPKSRGPNI